MSSVFEVVSPGPGARLDFTVVTGRRTEVLSRELHNLHVTDCHLMRALPSIMLELKSLEHLTLSRLFTVRVLPDMRQLPRLQHLVLIKLPLIRQLCGRTAGAPQLTTVTVSAPNNNLVVQPLFYAALAAKLRFKLLSLDLVTTPFAAQTALLTALETLHVQAPSPLTAQIADLSPMVALRDLRLSTMPALQHLPASMWTVRTLEELTLHDLGLAEIAAGVGALAALTKLRLCQLETVERLPEAL